MTEKKDRPSDSFSQMAALQEPTRSSFVGEFVSGVVSVTGGVPPDGSESEHVGSDALGDVGGVGVDVAGGSASRPGLFTDGARGGRGVDRTAVGGEGGEVAGGLGALDRIEESLVPLGQGTGGHVFPAPRIEDRRVRGGVRVGAGDGDDVNGAAPITEGLPEGAVGRRPRNGCARAGARWRPPVSA